MNVSMSFSTVPPPGLDRLKRAAPDREEAKADD
jgi:hypothetical protein